MSKPAAPDEQGTSTRPYLIRALHEWCTDNGFTPYLAVHVTAGVQVPMEYVKANEIVLNVGFEATSSLSLGNEFVEFKARFGGVSREIVVPIDHVVAIYARENGQGMAFPSPASGSGAAASAGIAAVPATAEPARAGLRLAGRQDSATAETPVMQPVVQPVLQPVEPSAGAPLPEPPAPTTGGRPTLKRIK